MSKTPIRLIDLFRYYRKVGHQTAAIGELEKAILEAAPDVFNRDQPWYDIWSSAVPAKTGDWLITREQISRISGNPGYKFNDAFMEDLNRLVHATGMTSLNQRRMLVAQTCHETAGYKYMTEIGNHAYFSRMYNNRSDLGNGPNDGYKYRGCGVIQLTGAHNYCLFAEASLLAAGTSNVSPDGWSVTECAMTASWKARITSSQNTHSFVRSAGSKRITGLRYAIVATFTNAPAG